MARRQLPVWQSAPLRVVLFAAGWAVSFLPRGLELFAGRLLGRFALLVDRRRSAIAAENIRRCLPELSVKRRGELLARNYEHYGILALELLHLFSPLPGHYRRYAKKNSRLHGFAHWKKAADRGQGILFASSHVGSWELLGAAGALAGIPITIVTRHITPPWLLRKVEASRLSVGVKAAYPPRTVPIIMRALRRGESVGFVIDQYAPPPQGLKVRFFGVEVDTLAAVGPLAHRTGAPVLPVSTRRDEQGIVHVTIEPELKFGPLLEDPQKVTQVLAANVERWVRADPEQWLWGHRRFKNVRWPAGRHARA